MLTPIFFLFSAMTVVRLYVKNILRLHIICIKNILSWSFNIFFSSTFQLQFFIKNKSLS